MNSKLMNSIIVVAALVAGFSGMARADDSSMNPFIGDSYAYFNGGNLPKIGNPVFDNSASSWRQSHPNGLTETQLQILSSETAGYRFNGTPAIDKAPSSFAESHPHGLSERELQALSSEAPAWQLPKGSATTALASTNDAAVAAKIAAK
jgi:hypothetical protein